MESKIFSYKVEGIRLQPVNDHLQVSETFDRKTVIEVLKALLNTDNVWKQVPITLILWR